MSVSATNAPPIRVLIAAGTAAMRTALSRIINSAASLQICGTARSGVEALEKIGRLQPDVVTLDIDMTLPCGLEVRNPPVVRVTSLTPKAPELTLEGLGVGAIDYHANADCAFPFRPEELRRDLIDKIEAAANHPTGGRLGDSVDLALSSRHNHLPTEFHGLPHIIALGTSTGGPQALQEILPQLPADLPVAIVVVQHMPRGFIGPLAMRLDSLSKMSVREARHGDLVEPGVVYIAPAGHHLTVLREPGCKAVICLSHNPPEAIHKPSVDVMMLSVAEAFGRHAMGIILTGMGKDGLLGMTAIREAGGFTVGQDKSTSAVYGMPRCCAESGVLQRVVPLFQIPGQILQAVHYYTGLVSLAVGQGT